LLVRGTQ